MVKHQGRQVDLNLGLYGVVGVAGHGPLGVSPNSDALIGPHDFFGQGFEKDFRSRGIVDLIIGIGGESVADAQLHRFRSQPTNAGRTCQQGLWNYSRHPNYFFERLHWFAPVA